MIHPRFSLGLILLLAPAVAFTSDLAPAMDDLRIGVSQASFGKVNPNDATAALKAWAVAFIREGNLKMAVQVEILKSVAEIRRALEMNFVQALSVTSEEFVELGDRPDYVFLNAKQDSCAWHYVVVTHREGNVNTLQALRGQRLVRHVSPITSPSLPWLETTLHDLNLGHANDLLGEIVEMDNPSKSVLRVFFRQSDACLVTTQAYDLACELNPQLRRQLKILASSPPYVSGLLYFRDSYTSPYRARIEASILSLHTTLVGQQVLTVFQGTRMEKHPLSYFDDTRHLYERYAKLIGGESAASKSSPATSTP